MKKDYPEGEYITFNMSVTAVWQEITDNKIIAEIKSKTVAALGADNKAEKDEILRGLVSELTKKTDPQFCKGVTYFIHGIELKDKKGDFLDKHKRPFLLKIGEDTHMKDALKQQNK